jgi:uncharacterized protein YqgV (UPF0045/DUF77 family)
VREGWEAAGSAVAIAAVAEVAAVRKKLSEGRADLLGTQSAEPMSTEMEAEIRRLVDVVETSLPHRHARELLTEVDRVRMKCEQNRGGMLTYERKVQSLMEAEEDKTLIGPWVIGSTSFTQPNPGSPAQVTLALKLKIPKGEKAEETQARTRQIRSAHSRTDMVVFVELATPERVDTLDVDGG